LTLWMQWKESRPTPFCHYKSNPFFFLFIMSDSFDEVVLLKLWERITKLYYIKAIHIYNQILYYKTRLMIKKTAFSLLALQHCKLFGTDQ
jgi:hypothetical protein